MSNPIYKTEVVKPTIMQVIQSHSPEHAADRIADLVVQIQVTAYHKGCNHGYAAGLSSMRGALLQLINEGNLVNS